MDQPIIISVVREVILIPVWDYCNLHRHTELILCLSREVVASPIHVSDTCTGNSHSFEKHNVQSIAQVCILRRKRVSTCPTPEPNHKDTHVCKNVRLAR